MQLLTVGVNHTTAPLAIREHLAFNNDHLGSVLNALISQTLSPNGSSLKVSEAAILSTCNRTEIYVKYEEAGLNSDAVIDWLARYHNIDFAKIKPYIYTLSDQAVVKHAFRVASGLDSMVLGEPQILGQFKQAVKIAENAGTLGTLLNKLFQRTFTVAKEVRTQTDIGASSISMSSAAVKLAQRIFGSIEQQKVLFIGAGEMIELCANHFAKQKPLSMTVANRTLERGTELATKIGGNAIMLNDLPEKLAEFDIVITSTASQLPIVGLGMVERAIKARKHRPIFMVDLAVPRDIEAEVADLDDVFLYTVDDLAEVVQTGMGNRLAAASQAEAIIEVRVENFMHWLKTRSAVPTIRALRDQAEHYRKVELEKALKLLARGEDPSAVLESLSLNITNKLLHHPSHALNTSKGAEHVQLETLVRQLFLINNLQ